MADPVQPTNPRIGPAFAIGVAVAVVAVPVAMMWHILTAPNKGKKR